MSIFRNRLDVSWTNHHRRTQSEFLFGSLSGFALLEALIAVTILGTGIVVALGAIVGSARLQQTNEVRLQAIHILEEKLIMVEQEKDLNSGSQSGLVNLGSRKFRWQMDVQALENQSNLQNFKGPLLEIKVVVEWPSRPRPRKVEGSCLVWKELQ